MQASKTPLSWEAIKILDVGFGLESKIQNPKSKINQVLIRLLPTVAEFCRVRSWQLRRSAPEKVHPWWLKTLL